MRVEIRRAARVLPPELPPNTHVRQTGGLTPPLGAGGLVPAPSRPRTPLCATRDHTTKTAISPARGCAIATPRGGSGYFCMDGALEGADDGRISSFRITYTHKRISVRCRRTRVRARGEKRGKKHVKRSVGKERSFRKKSTCTGSPRVGPQNLN